MRTQAVEPNQIERKKTERGIALVISLLLLALLTGLTIAMFLSVNSDMMTNGYYKNFRGSFYAADSGSAIVRQDIANELLTNMDSGFSATKPPFGAGIDTTVLDIVKKKWEKDSDNSQSILDGAVAGSVPAKFRIEPGTLKLWLPAVGGCSLEGATGTCDAPVGEATRYTYSFGYDMVVIGQAGGQQQNRIHEGGVITVDVPVGMTRPSNFSGYGLYVQHYDLCPSGSSGFASGTISGPVYTEGCLTFGVSQSTHFKDPVGCGGADAGWYFSAGNCIPAHPKGHGTVPNPYNPRSVINPDLQGNIYYGQDKPELPANDFKVKQALLDGIGTSKVEPTTADMKFLKDVNKDGFTGNKGVYLGYSDDSKEFVGGGIYVNGDAKIKLSTAMTEPYLGSGVSCPAKQPACFPQQIYEITQGGKTTTVTITAVPNKDFDPNQPYDRDTAFTLMGTGVGQTTVTDSDGGKLTIPDIPKQKDPSKVPVNNATLLYVDGKISGLSGQVQDDTALTVSAASDIVVTSDIKYKTKPLTTVENESVTKTCCVSKDKDNPTPSGTLVPGNNTGQALGLFTAKGDLVIKAAAAGNLEIDATIGTISEGGDGGLKFDDYTKKVDKLTILGGRIHNDIYTVKSTQMGSRDVVFDRRFGGKFAPPFFPATELPVNTKAADVPKVSFRRLQWVNESAY